MVDQYDGKTSRVAADVPTTHKTALVHLAHARSTPHETVPMATLIREAITEYFENHSEELPEEARDALDDDLLANAGGSDE